MYIWIYVCIHIHINRYVCVYIYWCTVYAYTHTQVHTQTHTRTHTKKHAHTLAQTLTHTHKHSHTRTHRRERELAGISPQSWRSARHPIHNVSLGSIPYVTWLVHIWGMVHLYEWPQSWRSARRCIQIVSHGSISCATCFAEICNMAHLNEWPHSWRSARRCAYEIEIWHTGWRGLIGCLKLQVIFRKRATNCRVLLQKMTYEDKTSYDSTPLCTLRCDNSAATHTNEPC